MPVEKTAQVSEAARRSACRKRTAMGTTPHRLGTLLDDLAEIGKDRIEPKLESVEPVEIVTRPTLCSARRSTCRG